MRDFRWKELGLSALLVALNVAIAVRFVGDADMPFSWQAFAQVYDPGPGGMRGPDGDGDGVADFFDPEPSVFSPSGCFYSKDTGRIFTSGAKVSVSGVGSLISDGSTDGCFQYIATMAGVVTISVVDVPARCALDADCPFMAGPFNPPGGGPTTLGNPRDPGDPTILTAAGCTPAFQQINLLDTSFGVFYNNIALVCPVAAAPVLSTWGWMLGAALLLAIGFWSLQRRRESTL